jgi:MerC mercury resistance protein
MSRPSVSISRIDRLGAGVSFLRAIHCAVLPFAATVLPLLGFGFLADERVEQMFLLTSIALASASVCWGIRVHRQRHILLLFGGALTLILTGKTLAKERLEIALAVPGAILFVCGHLVNQHLARRCGRCSHP